MERFFRQVNSALYSLGFVSDLVWRVVLVTLALRLWPKQDDPWLLAILGWAWVLYPVVREMTQHIERERIRELFEENG